MPHRFHIVDVFAEARYAGNPLAVVRDAAHLDTATMQAIAREFGFSETTFLVSDPRDAQGAGVRVRIFTPGFELPFAGHPTLGTAWVLREHLLPGRPRELTLALGAGPVPVAFEPEAGGPEVAWLTAPPVALGPKIPAEAIAPALCVEPSDLDPVLPAQRATAGPGFAIVPLRRRETLARVRFDLDAYRDLARGDASTGVYVFAREAENPANHMRARMFFESAGVREDPATGSATACLGAYLLAHRSHGDAFTLRIEQGCEMGRPSLLHLDARRTDGEPRIRVGGRVIESARGELTR
jgi:trans-2,3-dihydro-3-hydroxyanthranilate isomerase